MFALQVAPGVGEIRTPIERLQTAWIQLQEHVNCVSDGQSDKISKDPIPGIKQVRTSLAAYLWPALLTRLPTYCMPPYLPVSIPIYLSPSLPTCILLHLPVSLPTHLCPYLPTCMPTCLPVSLYIPALYLPTRASPY